MIRLCFLVLAKVFISVTLVVSYVHPAYTGWGIVGGLLWIWLSDITGFFDDAQRNSIYPAE